jgi:hypothetical protein
MSRREDYTDEEWDELVETFADPGGNSALRRASASNPRNLPCPNCGELSWQRAIVYVCVWHWALQQWRTGHPVIF